MVRIGSSRKKLKRVTGRFKLSALFFILLIMLVPFVSFTANADGGLIPFHNLSVFEPGQKAIIAWDGETEIMILSVDVYSTDDTKALHMVPFPSLPEVKLGDISVFERMEELINSKYYNLRGESAAMGDYGAGNTSINIVFHEKIGPHDITVVYVNSSQHFISWVTAFLEDKGIEDVAFPQDTEDVVDHYIDQDIRYFAFDVVDIESDEKSVEPLIYTFSTDYLYFPLKISSIIEGETKITLVLVTPEDLPLNTARLRSLGFHSGGDIWISYDELAEVSQEIAELISGNATVIYTKRSFYLKDLEEDIKLPLIKGVEWMHIIPHDYFNFFYFYHILGQEDMDLDGKPEIAILIQNTVYALNAEDGSLLWQFSIDDQYYYSTPIIYDVDDDGIKEIAIPVSNGIYTLNAEDGSLLWMSLNFSSPHIRIEDINTDGSHELIVHSEGYIHALNGHNGSEIWIYGSGVGSQDFIYSVFDDMDSDGKMEISVATGDGVLLINAETGLLEWQFTMDNGPRGMHHVCDVDRDGTNEIIVSSYDKVYVINCEDGTVLWATDISHFSGASLEIINKGDSKPLKIVVFDRDEVEVRRGEDGDLLWKYSSEDNYRLDLLALTDVNKDGISDLLITQSNITHAFNGEDGTELWQSILFERYSYYYADLLCNEDIDSDGDHDLILGHYGDIVAINSENGSRIWQFDDPGSYEYFNFYNQWFGDIDSDGKSDMIVRTWGKIYALRIEDGHELWNFSCIQSINNLDFLDIDNNGQKEMLACTNNKIYALNFQETQMTSVPTGIAPKPKSDAKDSSQLVYWPYVMPAIVIFFILIVFISVTRITKRKSKK